MNFPLFFKTTKIFIIIFFIFQNIEFLHSSENLKQKKLKENMEIKSLVCEYLNNPIGIDVEKPRLSWKIFSDEENLLQTSYEIRFAESIEDLNASKELFYSTGKVISDKSINVVYEGPALKSFQRLYWQVRVWDNKNRVSNWSEPAFWEMGILKPELWEALWITNPSEPITDNSKPCPYFRKNFYLSKKIRSARIYVTSLGLYQLFLNGKKVSEDLFTPGWTSYNKRLQYQVYDVTNLLDEGENAIGVILGDGWYRGRLTWDENKRNVYGDKLATLLQIRVTYIDGTNEILVKTDNSWKTSTGPILFSDIYDGEFYDARLEFDNWNKPNFNDKNWQNVLVINHPKNTLIASQSVPVKAIQEIKPIKILTTPKSKLVYDLGQNMVGWVRLKVKGKQGQKITLKFAEILDKEGNFYTENLRKAKCTDVYILKGKGEEIYEPHFTFHGFRFVKVEGLTEIPTLDNITGIVIHSDMQPTGKFECSNPQINQLQHNINWGQKGNFLDVPTDCPQRDERLGWTGDAQVFCKTASFNFNTASFYTKWLKDLKADQLDNGKVPHVIPDVLNGDGGSTAWADAAVIIPWIMYLNYDDIRILEEQYSSIKAWVDYMISRLDSNNLWIGDSHFGDWLAYATNLSDYPGATTEKDLIANAYFIYSSEILVKIAKLLGKNEDVSKYYSVNKKVKEAFIKEFVTPNGRLVSHTQTAYSLALAFKILPDELAKKAVSYLEKDVKKFGHITCGFVGTPLLCKSLSENNLDYLAFMLLNRKEYPSWLYPVTQGATTIWERWDGQKPDGSFQDPGMNSFNHYAYGAIGEWLYQYVSGLNIDEDKPGYKHIIFAPHIGGNLSYSKVEYNSMYGLILSSWKIENSIFNYEVIIPPNTTGTIELPGISDLDKLQINSKPINEEMKSKIKINNSKISITFGSGRYNFKYPI